MKKIAYYVFKKYFARLFVDLFLEYLRKQALKTSNTIDDEMVKTIEIIAEDFKNGEF